MTTSYDCAGKDLLYRMSLCLHALKEQMQELEAIRGTHLEQAFPCEHNEVRYVIFCPILITITLSMKIDKSSRSGATVCSCDRQKIPYPSETLITLPTLVTTQAKINSGLTF